MLPVLNMIRRDLMLVLGALVLGACGATKEKPPPEPPVTPQPVTKEVGSAGGVVSVTGYEGWQFDLGIPSDAVETTSITVTPLTGVEGFEFSGQVIAALRLEPDGLTFSQPVTLTVSPPQGVALPVRPGAFSTSDAGVESIPAVPRGGAVELSVLHFSDVALVDFDAAVASAESYALAAFERFMEWTGAYASRDYDYFSLPGAPFGHVPTCADAASVVNHALGLVRMFDVLSDDEHANEVIGQLGMVLSLMVDGFAGANLVCGDTGDDTLVLQCAAAAEKLNDMTGMEFGVPQKCGATTVKATPDHAILDIGQSASISFSVLDGFQHPLSDRPVRTALAPSSPPAAVTMVQVNDVEVRVTCAAYGWTAVFANDARAQRFGYSWMRIEVPIICSPSGISMTPGRAFLIGNDRVTFEAAVLDPDGNEVPLGPPLQFVWESRDNSVQVIPDAANSARAEVGRKPTSSYIGSTTIRACFGELYPCELGIEAPVTVVPDVRGTWYGVGWLTAQGCRDDEDNGFLMFSNWQATFTQSISLSNPPASDITAAFSGTAIGVRVLAPLVGTLGPWGALTGSADYHSASGLEAGSTTFQGHFDVLAEGYETVVLDFTFRDTKGDTCTGTGRVTFRKV